MFTELCYVLKMCQLFWIDKEIANIVEMFHCVFLKIRSCFLTEYKIIQGDTEMEMFVEIFVFLLKKILPPKLYGQNLEDEHNEIPQNTIFCSKCFLRKFCFLSNPGSIFYCT